MKSEKLLFFRESGWMVVATFLGGVCMFAVHSFALKLTANEYGILLFLLSLVNLITIPSLGLQTVFAQQTASAIRIEEEESLRGTVRGVMKVSLLLWFVLCVV